MLQQHWPAQLRNESVWPRQRSAQKRNEAHNHHSAAAARLRQNTPRKVTRCDVGQLLARLQPETHSALINRLRSLKATETDFDEAFIAAYGDSLPGRQFSTPRMCESAHLKISLRPKWVAQTLESAWGEKLGSRQRNVAEIGPCGLPCHYQPYLSPRVQKRVRTLTIDFTKDMTILAKNCFHADPVDLVSDAQTLSGVSSNSLDGIMAFHVLEHMVDPLGAIEAWLRVLRPGGVVMFAVPDACSSDPNGDKYRLTASPQHFISDHETAKRLNFSQELMMQEGARLHGLEASLSLATFFLDTARGTPSIKVKPADKKIVSTAPCPGMPMAVQPFSQLMRWTREHVFPTRDPHQSHFHAWSAPTMRQMLEAAHAVMPSTPYAIIEVFSSQRNPMQMQELHVALRRL